MAKLPEGSEQFDWGSEPDYSAPSGSDEFRPGSSEQQIAADKSGFRGPKQPSCALKALSGLWGGAKFGLLAGAVGTSLEVVEWGLRGPAAVSAVLRGAASGAFAFGSGIGLYRGTVCGFEQIRGVQDIYNSMLAGGVVGALSEVPLMLRSYLLRDIEKALGQQGRFILKPRPRFFVNSALGAAGCGMLHLLESSSRSSRPAEQTQRHKSQTPIEAMSGSNKDIMSFDGWGVQRQDGMTFEEDASVELGGEFAVEPYWESSEAANTSNE